MNLAAPGWAVVDYSRAQALTERAVLPVTFDALDGDARWLEPAQAGPDGNRTRHETGPHRLAGSHPTETTRPALFTALRTDFADALSRRAFDVACAERRAPGGGARTLPEQAARDRARPGAGAALPRPAPPVDAAQVDGVRLAISGERDAHEMLAAYRLCPEPSALVAVAMAYEGLDAPEVAVVAALISTSGVARGWSRCQLPPRVVNNHTGHLFAIVE